MPKTPEYGFQHQDLEVLHLVNKKVAMEQRMTNDIVFLSSFSS